MTYTSVLDNIDGSKTKPLPTMQPVTVIDANGNATVVWVKVG